MKALTNWIFIGLGLVVLSAPSAFAAGTTAGVDITNTATVDYEVGSVAQPQETSNLVTFKVDRRINVTVAEVGAAYTDVAPNAQDEALHFTVTNGTNDVVDFRLTYTQDAGGTDPFGGTDDFDTSNVTFFLEQGSNAGYQVLEDTTPVPGGATPYLDNVAADAVIIVYVVSDIPAAQPDNDTSGGTLTAIANTDGSGGAANDYTETAGADNPLAVDTVFGDGAGDTDLAGDGKHSDDDAYRITSATIGVTKTSIVISDPFNGTTDPKAIPGAVIEFCIQVANSGGTDATNVVITDAAPANTTYVAESIVVGGSVDGGTGACNPDGTGEDDNNTDADEDPPVGANIDGGGVITVTIANVAAGATTTAIFQVTID